MYRKILVFSALLCSFLLLSSTLKVLSQSAPEADIKTHTHTNATDYNTLVEATYGSPNTLDPAWNYETIGNHVIQQIYDPLLTLNRERTDEYIPMLATGWTISPDGQTYTFNIRPGVRFHNGNTLTAGDVAYTFQRGILQGGGSSPQWLFTEPILGAGLYDMCSLFDSSICDDREALQALQTTDPTTVENACTGVTNAIVADDSNGTVTFHLAQPWSPFLATLVGSWGSILDKEWTVENGGWDGDCSTWHNYYAVDSDTTPLRSIANGTGPYMLNNWTEGVEVVLDRNPLYWRNTPMWPGGPFGPAAIEQVSITEVPSATVRAQMLLTGEADIALVDSADWNALDNQVMLSYNQPDGLAGTLQNPSGSLKLYTGGLSASAFDAFFIYDINIGGSLNYIGSGALDGNGIPPDFFTDIHVRKAFNYAFNWQRYIHEAYNGEAVQRRGPIIKGILGYNETQPTYFYSPTLAMQEFNQAWSDEDVILPTTGFSMTIAYASGNLVRQTAAEVIKDGIEALNPNYHINIVSLDFPDLLADYRNGSIPIGLVYGWGQDIPDPYNWVHPHLKGSFAYWQNLPGDQWDIYQTKIDNCLALTGSAAQACYEDIQNTTYLQAKDIYLAQPKKREYIRAEVQGYYSNLAMQPYFYALSKGPLPTVESVAPEVEQTVTFSSTLGATAAINLPAGTVSQTVDIVITPDVPTSGPSPAFRLADFAFDMQAFSSANGSLIPDPQLDNPISVTINYNEATIGTLMEETLTLLWWNGSEWQEAACGEIVRDLQNNSLQVPICHLSKFALAGISNDIYLPQTLRNSP